MIPTDKEIANLIKKIQRQVGTTAKTRKDTPKEEVEALDTSSEIFDEMKKLPYTS
jgi:predicted transcriptional regulator